MESVVEHNLMKAMEYLGRAINANCDSSTRKGNKELGKRLRKIDADLDEVFEDFRE